MDGDCFSHFDWVEDPLAQRKDEKSSRYISKKGPRDSQRRVTPASLCKHLPFSSFPSLYRTCAASPIKALSPALTFYGKNDGTFSISLRRISIS